MTDRWLEEIGGRPAGKAPTIRAHMPKRRMLPAGCEHTEDPAGWLMDAEGEIVGRCNCGEVTD
jgi:hypothetical protein